jgi:hypothetical protein
MPRITTILAASVLALTLSGPARAGEPGIIGGSDATPNFLGSTGLLETPDADTVGDKGFSVFAGFNPRYNGFGLLFGPIDRLEIGVSFLDFDNGGDDLAVNAKFALLKESDIIPGFAVGVVDAFDEFGADASWYIVASKDLRKLLPVLPFNVSANVGYGGGFYGDDPFASLEFGIGTPLDLIPISKPRFSFIPEVRNGNVNLALRGKWRGFAATIGLFDFDRVGALFSYSAGLRL